jgi:hypothetical protein
MRAILLIGSALVFFCCAAIAKAKTHMVKNVRSVTGDGQLSVSSQPITNSGAGSLPQLFINTGPMYFPKWKKLKYWQPTKKNPKRR